MHSIKEDKWLGNFLDKKAFALHFPGNEIVKLDRAIYQKFTSILDQDCFIYAKIPTENIKVVSFLEQYGFRVVDTNVMFQKPILTNKKQTYARETKKQDSNAVVELAKNNFTYTRFHLDPKISDDIADEIKAGWMRNYFAGNRGNFLAIVEREKKIAGFCLVIYGRDNSIIIDLIATDKKYQRTGVARQLVEYIENKYQDKEQIIVGTQVANIASIRFYEKQGFRIAGSKYVLHYHKE